MEVFAKIVKGLKPLNIFPKNISKKIFLKSISQKKEMFDGSSYTTVLWLALELFRHFTIVYYNESFVLNLLWNCQTWLSFLKFSGYNFKITDTRYFFSSRLKIVAESENRTFSFQMSTNCFWQFLEVESSRTKMKTYPVCYIMIIIHLITQSFGYQFTEAY